MLSVLIRLVRSPWDLAASYLPKLWTHLLRLTRFVRPRPPSEASDSSIWPNQPAFPATEDQRNQIRKQFIESLDADAVCALASRMNNGRPCQIVRTARGSFNMCFFVEFEQHGPKWIVRVPIESSLEDPWTKLISEVTTML